MPKYHHLLPTTTTTTMVATAATAAKTTRPQRTNPLYMSTTTTSSSSSSSSSGDGSGGSTTTTTTATATGSESATTKAADPTQHAPLRRVKTADATTPTAEGESIVVKGWVRTIRKQKTLAFVEVNDGSDLNGLQCVIPFDDTLQEGTMEELDKVTTGCSVAVTGPLVSSRGGKQKVELMAASLKVVGSCPPDTYPLAKKRHSLEYLRTIAHLRPRTNTIAAVSRVRSILAGSIHAYFQRSGFVYVQTPLITASDCEGAGEMFRVTTLDLDDLSSIPRRRRNGDDEKEEGAGKDQHDDGDDENKKEDEEGWSKGADYAEDFFGKPAYLTVSGQLCGETYASALGDVYTFGPTFRAENSQTTRHLAEFHMVEPEMAFADLDDAMDNAEGLLKSVVSDVLEKCRSDIDFFQRFYDKSLRARLERVVTRPFARVSYRRAVEYLQEEIAKDPTRWQFPDVRFGTDLATEHERWLAETKFDSAVFVHDYPKSIKAFYMRDNDDDDGETVHAMDLLVPGVGELIGGSQREERLDMLTKKMEASDLNPEDYWWYLDLRRYGTVPHSGYGLGFERLVTYVCGIENIREAIAFPRYPGNAEF